VSKCKNKRLERINLNFTNLENLQNAVFCRWQYVIQLSRDKAGAIQLSLSRE